MRVFLLYGTGGGGHKASADALLEELSKRQPTWDVRLVNISPAVGAESGDRLYNLCMERNWSILIPVLNTTARVFGSLLSPFLRVKMGELWSTLPSADVCVSLVPFVNSVIIDSLPKATHLTVVTDFTHSEAHPWIQDPRQTIICGTDECYQQAVELAMPMEKIVKTSGMVVSPRFYEKLDKSELDRITPQINFSTNSLTALVFFGGIPPTTSTRRLTIQLLRKGFNVIVLCGRNDGLLHDLCKIKLTYPELCLYLKNFTRDVSTYMQLSDVVIGKPGPGVVSEALVSGRPMILYNEGGRVMAQERAVMDWVESHGVGYTASTVEHAASVTRAQITDMQEKVNGLPQNRAIFEVADLVEQRALGRGRNEEFSARSALEQQS